MTTQAFNLSQFANYLNSSGQVSQAGIQSGVVLESGTVSLYYQSSAPTGWTQVTSLNDYALRLVSSSGGTTGGTTAFSTVFTNQTISTTVEPTVSTTILTSSTLYVSSKPVPRQLKTMFPTQPETGDVKFYAKKQEQQLLCERLRNKNN